jgi:hypothetical protein
MSFDPESVERGDVEAHHDFTTEFVSCEGGQYVRASDYDALLALWRESEPWPCDSAHIGQ